ncbi:unnamed protein product [Orchesella dallaii]|uniref:Cell division control protein 45 n=1 Tax=Orchesella dallaii TaxID=48710 RepID=A0ABP1R0L6_9HEXA
MFDVRDMVYGQWLLEEQGRSSVPPTSTKMLVEHYRRDFIERIVGHRLIIITNQDVDAVCTVKILTTLFKTEGIQYILLSCSGLTELKAKYDEYNSQSDRCLLINCGGTIDVLDLLGNPPREKLFFILDYHRPLNILNYYNTTGQVVIISVLESEENIPEFDEIFREEPPDSSEEEDDHDDDEALDANGMNERQRRKTERRAQRQLYTTWVKKREHLLFTYREHFYYSRPSALYGLEIVWGMSRDDMESVWSAIVSLTDSLVLGRLPRPKYCEYASTVNDHILRISNANQLPRDCLKIRFERDLFLFLYRHWSVYDSLKTTPYVVSTLKTWSQDGHRKLKQMLAHLGLPLSEVKQKYANMSLDLRRQLVEMFSSQVVVENYKLPDLVFGSFVAEIGFRPKFNALDVQLATLALLEEPDPNKTEEERFLLAVLGLDVRNFEKGGIEKAKGMMKQVNNQVQMMVEMKLVQEVGPFLFVQLTDSMIDFNYFKRPAGIPLLANFLQHAGIRAGKKGWRQSPWLIMIPYDQEYFVAVGVQPGAFEQADKNIFPEVFRCIKGKMGEDVVGDWFDGWAILVKNQKRQVFADLLLALSE